MAEFDLQDLERIYKQEDLMQLLVDKGIIKEKKFINQLTYERELNQLQFLLLKLQNRVIEEKKRVLVIFEGRDTAGKGGTISRVVEKLNPKKYKVVALSKPTEKEQGQWYFQRYFKHLPNAGEMVFFDRSWYNRAVVEPVFGFCSDEQHESFMKQVLGVEKLLQDDGIVLVKIFLSISKEEQFERLEDRKNNPMKHWKIGGLDKQAQEKWEVYSHYIEKMLSQTGTQDSPWIEIKTDKKKAARLEAMKYVINQFQPKDKSLKNSSEVVFIHK